MQETNCCLVTKLNDTTESPSAPCTATNLKTTADCNSDMLISTWDMASGALSYWVEVFGNSPERNYYNCSSVTNSCAMPGVHCGESLTVRITSDDNECFSEKFLGDVAVTGNQAVSCLSHTDSDCPQSTAGRPSVQLMGPCARPLTPLCSRRDWPQLLGP